MSTKTYTTLGSTVEISAGGSVQTVGFENDIAMVGGYDASNTGSNFNSAGEVYEVNSDIEAQNLFGADSELARAVAAAQANGVSTMYCVPVPETSVTGEDPSAGVADQLENAPIFDPTVHAEHDITDQNGNTINVSYDISTETVDGTEGYVNPVNGNFKGEGTTTYALDYDYGDYSSSILETAVSESVRYVWVGTENSGVKSTLVTQLGNEATDFDFKRGIVGAEPAIAASDISDYTPSQQDWRLIEVAPARGTAGSDDYPVRPSAAFAGLAAIQPINVNGSTTYDVVNALTGLDTEYSPSETTDFSQVTPITRDFEVAEGVTTSATSEFQDIYAVEIVDMIAESIFLTAKTFAGGGNLEEDRDNLEGALQRLLRSFWTQSPPAIASGDGTQPYSVTLSQGATDTEADVDVGIEPAPIMKQVDINVKTGTVTTFGGATA